MTKKLWQGIGAIVLLVIITNTSAWDYAVQKLIQTSLLAFAVYGAYWLTVIRPRQQRRQQNSQSRRTP